MTRHHDQPHSPPAPAIAASELAFHGHGLLAVSSPSFEHEAPIPDRHSAYHAGRSPALEWTAGPEGTVSYALMLEDPDAPGGAPYVHWVLYNVPATVTRLAEGLPDDAALDEPSGALQGANTRGTLGYFGPRPPKSHGAHRYCFEVFALDTALDLAPGAEANELKGAMRGHVLAHGVLTGRYAARA